MNIPSKLQCTKTFTVTDKDTALSHGSGDLSVLATPAMIAFLENAAMHCVKKALPEDQTTVGTEIQVKHIRATPVGGRIEAKAELTGMEERKLLFSLEAYDKNGKIGFGAHTRYVVETSAFLKNIEKNQA